MKRAKNPHRSLTPTRALELLRTVERARWGNEHTKTFALERAADELTSHIEAALWRRRK